MSAGRSEAALQRGRGREEWGEEGVTPNTSPTADQITVFSPRCTVSSGNGSLEAAALQTPPQLQYLSAVISHSRGICFDIPVTDMCAGSAQYPQSSVRYSAYRSSVKFSHKNGSATVDHPFKASTQGQEQDISVNFFRHSNRGGERGGRQGKTLQRLRGSQTVTYVCVCVWGGGVVTGTGNPRGTVNNRNDDSRSTP